MASAPPQHIVVALHRAVPGIWSFVVGSVNGAAAGRRVRVNSWYRTTQRNDAVGGDGDSQHLIGTALDLGGEDRAAVARDLQRAGWVRVSYGSHEHVQLWPAGVARQSGLLRSLGV